MLPGESVDVTVSIVLGTDFNSQSPWVLTVPLAQAFRRAFAAPLNVSTRNIVILAAGDTRSGVAYSYSNESAVNAADAAYRRRRGSISERDHLLRGPHAVAPVPRVRTVRSAVPPSARCRERPPRP